MAVYNSFSFNVLRLPKNKEDLNYKLKLLFLLVKRDQKTRYQRSLLGVFWSLINPSVTAIILYSLFKMQYSGKIQGGFSYGPYVLSGTLVLALFGTGVITATQSFQSSAYIFTRLPAPIDVFAINASLSPVINASVGLIPLLIWNIIAGGTISNKLLLLPLFFLIAIIYLTGLALINFTILIRFGDYINILSLTATLLTFLTPIFYPVNSISEKAKMVVNLNPVTHFLNIFRYLTSGTGDLNIREWLFIFLLSFSILIFGVIIFNKTWNKSASLL